MKAMFFTLVLIASVIFTRAEAAEAISPTPSFANASQFQEYQQLSNVIRCPTCQDQNIANSNSPLAVQLRQLIATQIKAGKSADEIKHYLIDRYGDFITYAPRFVMKTWGLWLAPFLIMLIIAALWLWRKSKKHPEGTLSAAQEAELDAWIKSYRGKA